MRLLPIIPMVLVMFFFTISPLTLYSAGNELDTTDSGDTASRFAEIEDKVVTTDILRSRPEDPFPVERYTGSAIFYSYLHHAMGSRERIQQFASRNLPGGKFEKSFSNEMNKAYSSARWKTRITFFAVKYIFVLNRLKAASPELEGEELFVEAAKLVFSPEALSRSGMFILGAEVGTIASQRLARAAVKSGLKVFRGASKVISGSVVPIGSMLADATGEFVGARKHEFQARIDRQSLLASLGSDRRKVLEDVSHRYFDRNGFSLFMDSLHPSRIDYAMIAAEGLVVVVVGDGSFLLTANPIISGLAVVAAADLLRGVVNKKRAQNFCVVDLREEYQNLINGALRVPPYRGHSGQMKPTASRNAQRLSRIIRNSASCFDTLVNRGEEASTRLQSGFLDIRASLIRSAIFAYRMDCYSDERLRLHGKVRTRHGDDKAQELFDALPKVFKASPLYDGYQEWGTLDNRHRAALTGSEPGGYVPFPEDYYRINLIEPLVSDVSTAVASVSEVRPDISNLLATTTLEDKLRCLWMEYHKLEETVSALITLREMEDKLVNEQRKAIGDLLPDGFLDMLVINRIAADERVGRLLSVLNLMKQVISSGFDGNEVLKEAESLWQNALTAYCDAAGEVVADTEIELSLFGIAAPGTISN